MPKVSKKLAESQRAANPTLKDAFTGQAEAGYGEVKSEACALSSEFDGNYVP
ncbi:hypothetical protein [Desulfotomaculum sp. 1211_IL3151]|uniref:hypothetical protein n=1 Tax=Desulfotomaculum sp. 1211_IL3151 TaxID=3084055 RepID=UPI002FDAA60D